MTATAAVEPRVALQASGTRAGGVLVTALAVASLHLPGRPTTLCTLRAVTGIPCPLCGGTTATVALGRGDLSAAFAASPLLVLGLPVFVLAPWRLIQRWRLTARVQLWVVISVAAALSELWQLHRFGFL